MKKTKWIINRLLVLTLLSGTIGSTLPVVSYAEEVQNQVVETQEVPTKETDEQLTHATEVESKEVDTQTSTENTDDQIITLPKEIQSTTETSIDESSKSEIKKEVKESKKIPVQILGINDFHGALSSTGTASIESRFSKVGKSFYLASEFNAAKAKFMADNPDGESIRVQAGDLVGASPSNSSLLQDEPTIKAMNRMNIEYGILGNHEFDEGLDEFDRIIKGGAAIGDYFNSITQNYPKEPSTMQILSANIFEKDGAIPKGYQPYAVKEVGSGDDKVKIGFIGVVTEEIPNLVLRKHVENYSFEDPATAIVRNAKILREEGVNAIVVIGHTGATQNGNSISGETAGIIDKMNQMDPENSVDAYFAGHSHSYANAEYNGVRVIQSTSQGKAFADVVGEIDVETKDFVNAPSGVVKPVLNDVSTPVSSLVPDASVKALVDEADTLVKTVTEEIIGKSATKETISRAVNNGNDQESAVGNLITDGQLQAARKENFDGGVHFAMTNNGGIRADLEVNQNGDITWGAAQAVQPFGNIMQVVSIKGSDIVEALNQQFKEFYFLQIAGMRYTYTGEKIEEKDESGKVIKTTDTRKVKDVFEVTADGKEIPLDLEKTYNIVINDFLFGGGDGFTAFTKGTLLGALDPDTDIFVKYIKGLDEVSAKVEGRKKPATEVNEKEFTILHTNDMHGRMAPEYNADKTVQNTIGMAKLKTFKDKEMPTLMLDAGDAVQGLPLSNFSQGDDMVKAMNAVGYDAMAVGNHEFDFSYEQAMSYKDKLNFPILAANIYKDGERSFQPYTHIEKDGWNFLVIGLTTPETYTKTHPNNIKGVDFEDPIPEAKKAILEAKSEYANVDFDQIIFVTHLGIDGSTPEKWRSTGVAKALNDDIDLKEENIMFVDGHSHTPMPEGREEGRVKVVQAGDHMKYVGKVDVKQEESESIYNAKLIPAKDFITIEEDPEVKAIVDNAIKNFDDVNKEVLVKDNPYLLNGVNANVRTRETNLGNLLADGIYHYAQTGFSKPADFSIINGGGIRESLKVGDITKGDVVTVLPFGNIISQVEIKGADIYKMFEVSVRSDVVKENDQIVLDENGLPKLGRNGGFLQISDSIRFFYDSNKQGLVLNKEGTGATTEGERVFKVEMRNRETGKFEAIDKEKVYYVATNDFLAAGGDGYYMLGGNREEGPSLDTVFADFLKNNIVVDSKTTRAAKIPLSNYKEELPDGGKGTRIISKLDKEVSIELNFVELDKAIVSAEKAKEADYTAASWKPFAESLATAKEVQKDGKEEGTKVTQAEIDKATVNLLTAQKGLVEKEKPKELDLTKLNEAITSAEKAKEADYTVASWKPFAESLVTAKKVQKDAKAEGTKVTQKEVDSAIAALTKAQEKLVKKQVAIGTGSENTGSGSTGNGKTTYPIGNLPQTGETESRANVIGLVLLGTTAVSAYYVFRKRDEDAA
ncbi:5'-nucleotidase C-terminal domain-containing protein [Vagococcus fluvialis]|uniref:5'-nucleotidase C-terminal domain-containing protein n=1 Tax=Vagococcus fluvialis TaxID=2738 RepID=UPI0022E11610|nr:5'-nucleotidase C-terminal domain-containing protein [Vagococcus fluvialis]